MEGTTMADISDALIQRARELTIRHAPKCRVSVGGGNIEGTAT
jgi:pyruvate formate lyase activating enzyme